MTGTFTLSRRQRTLTCVTDQLESAFKDLLMLLQRCKLHSKMMKLNTWTLWFLKPFTTLQWKHPWSWPKRKVITKLSQDRLFLKESSKWICGRRDPTQNATTGKNFVKTSYNMALETHCLLHQCQQPAHRKFSATMRVSNHSPQIFTQDVCFQVNSSVWTDIWWVTFLLLDSGHLRLKTKSLQIMAAFKILKPFLQEPNKSTKLFGRFLRRPWWT